VSLLFALFHLPLELWGIVPHMISIGKQRLRMRDEALYFLVPFVFLSSSLLKDEGGKGPHAFSFSG